MHFGFTEEQVSLQKVVRDVLSGNEERRQASAASAAQPFGRSLWSQLCEIGLPAVLAAPDAGGLGLDERWLVLVLEEAGYRALSLPIVETAAVAPPLLAGQIPPDALVATDLGGNVVPFATVADYFLLAQADGSLSLAEAADVAVEPVDTVDPSRHAGRVTSTRRAVATLPADDGQATDRGVWGTSALLVGLAQRMLDITVDYVRQREQFGVPVGSFQAVKHHLADASVAIAFARPLLYRATWSLAVDAGSKTVDVAMAKVMASQAADVAARKALQCHGAMGYTQESDLHVFMKQAWALMRSWGDQHHHRERVARSLAL